MRPLPDDVTHAFGVGDAEVEVLAGGRTNRTLRVRAGHDLVLQHLRSDGHGDLLGVMENLVRVTTHLDWRHRLAGGTSADTWWPVLVPTTTGKPYLMTPEGDLWRAFHYVDGRVARGRVPRRALISAAGLFGAFTETVADIDDPPLIVTDARFHDLEAVTEDLVAARGDAASRGETTVLAEVDAVLTRHDDLAGRLDRRLVADGFAAVADRVVHNDTKLANVLLDHTEPVAVGVLDLDLVMPGPVWHDVGDLLRSASWHDLDDGRPAMSRDLFVGIVAAYVARAPSLTDDEIVTFAAAGARLAYELGLRYLADHLRPIPVLRVSGERGHLRRGEANMRLADEMLGAYDALRSVVDDLITARTRRG